MLEINVIIKAPELAGAILSLAAALSAAASAKSAALPPTPVDPIPAATEAVTPVATPAPVFAVPTTPTASPIPVTSNVVASAAQIAPAAPPVVPTAAAPTYTRDQIMTAGAALIDAGKINELMGLFNAFGVQAVTQIKQEQLGAFATELRKLGASI